MTKEFIQYLKDAIIIKRKIQISGLGTFYGEYQSAQLVENNKLLPPNIHLQFSEKVNKEDESMVSFLVNEAGLPKELGLQMVKIFVQDVKSNLASNRSALIGDLGKLHYDVKQELVFSPSEKSNFYAESAALESTIVDLNQNKFKSIKKQMKNTPPKKEKAKASFSTVQAKESKVKIPNLKSKKLWPVWVVLIVLFLAIPILSLYLNKETPKNMLFSLVNETVKVFWGNMVAATENITKTGLFNQSDSLQSGLEDVYADAELNENNSETNPEYEEIGKTEESQESVANAEEVVKETPKENTAKGKLVDKHYALTGIGEAKIKEIKLATGTELYLIAGSFKNQDNANRLKEDLINMGYQSGIIQAEGGLNRVTLGKFVSVDEALVVFERFHAKKPEVGVWLLVRE
jgi:cell division septation protein DedD/nucleoid DNA-binding protein